MTSILTPPPEPSATPNQLQPNQAPLAKPTFQAAPSQTGPTSKSSRKRRLLRMLQVVVVAVGIGASFLLDTGIFGALLVLFLIIAPFEKLYPRQKGQRLRRPMVATDIAFALLAPVLNVAAIIAGTVIGGLSLFWLPGLALRPVVASLPPVFIPIFAFLAFDFLGYWTHRWAHEVPLLWRFHAVHHSPEHMDWISGVRIHPFDGVLIAPAFFFLLAAGIDVELTGVFAFVQIVLGIFFHANVRVRWRWLDRIVANPEFHHWHHANETDAIGHNYAPALPQWDMLFGTFFMPSRQSDRRPTHYGVDEYHPRNVLGLLTYPLRGARKLRPRSILRGLRSLARAVRRSTFRRTHSVRRATTPGCTSTNRSLFEPTAPRRRVVEF